MNKTLIQSIIDDLNSVSKNIAYIHDDAELARAEGMFNAFLHVLKQVTHDYEQKCVIENGMTSYVFKYIGK